MAGHGMNIEPALRQQFYHTPTTPSSLKGKPTLATSFDSPQYLPSRPNTSRKRSRNDSWDHDATGSAVQSPAPLANMNYQLAGGLETPSGIPSQYSAYDASPAEISFRGGKWYAQQSDYFHSHGGETIRGMPGKDGNGRAPQPIYSKEQKTWGSLVFNIAGKFLDFCTAGSFRGFFSGGGQGYALESPAFAATAHSPDESQWLDVPTAESADLDEESRATKKSKTGPDNWVVVNAPESPALRSRQSFIPRPTTPTTASMARTRTNSTASAATIGRPQLTKRPTANLRRTLSTRTASSAGLRSPEPSSYIQQSSPERKHHRAGSSLSGRASLHSRRNSRGISPVTTTPTRTSAPISASSTSSGGQAESPLAKETRMHLENVRKKELAEDREIMKMNKQLKEMIRQGQEALGTKVEVDYDEEGDDW